MKKLTSLILVFLITIFSASAGDTTKFIQIIIKNEWRMTITPTGILGLSSLTSSDPLLMTKTKEGVIDYVTVKQKITSGRRFSNQRPEESAIALVDNSEKFLVSEDMLLQILQVAGKANQWQGDEISARLLAQLDKRPVLKNKESQNKALHSNRAVEPPKTKNQP